MRCCVRVRESTSDLRVRKRVGWYARKAVKEEEDWSIGRTSMGVEDLAPISIDKVGLESEMLDVSIIEVPSVATLEIHHSPEGVYSLGVDMMRSEVYQIAE